MKFSRKDAKPQRCKSRQRVVNHVNHVKRKPRLTSYARSVAYFFAGLDFGFSAGDDVALLASGDAVVLAGPLTGATGATDAVGDACGVGVGTLSEPVD